METLLDLWRDVDLRRDLVASLVLVLVVVLLRLFALRAVRSLTPSARDALRLRWRAYAKGSAWVVLFFGLIAIWATELQTFALSLVAFAVAIVLATKELILCVSGSIVRTSSGSFSLGDRIEVADIRGDVIAHGLLSTTVLEIGPNHARTGRAVTLPNSLLLSHHVINETHTDHFVLHTITVPFPRRGDWKMAERVLLEAASEVCGEHQGPASRYLDAHASQHGVGKVTTEPRVFVIFDSEDSLRLLLRVPTPAREKGPVEQAIVRRFLESDAAERT